MRVLIVSAALLAAFALPAAADDCSDIVASTVAELRAGEPDWDDRAEAIARRAAGAACVKAATATAAMAEEPALENAAAGAAATATAAAVTDEQSPDATATPEDEVDDGKAGWKFLGFDVNKVDGSPSQKPYARKR